MCPRLPRNGILLLLVLCSMTSARGEQLLQTFEVGDVRFSRHIAFSSNERYLAANARKQGGGGTDCTIAVWDIVTGQQIAALPIRGGSGGQFAFIPSQTMVVFIDYPNAGGRITFWDFEQNTTRDLPVLTENSGIRLQGEPFVISPDGEFMALHATELRKNRGENWLVRVARTDDGSVVGELKLRGIGRQLRFSGDGSRLFISDQLYRPRSKTLSAYVYEWDFRDEEEPHEWGPFPVSGATPQGWSLTDKVVLSRDGKLLASKVGNRVVVIDVASGNYVNTGQHRTVSFDPRRYYLAGGGNSTSVSLWPLIGEHQFRQFEQPGITSVSVVKFSPSGNLLAVAGSTGEAWTGKLNLWKMVDATIQK